MLERSPARRAYLMKGTAGSVTAAKKSLNMVVLLAVAPVVVQVNIMTHHSNGVISQGDNLCRMFMDKGVHTQYPGLECCCEGCVV